MRKPLENHNIAVAMPVYDGKIPVTTTSSLIQLSHMIEACGGKMSFLSQVGVAIVQIARNQLLSEVIANPSITGVLMIDGDIYFDAIDAMRLIAASGKHDIMAGLYRAKTETQDLYFVDPDTEASPPYDEYGIMPCKRIPLGFAYVKRHVLQKLWDDHEGRMFNSGNIICRNVFDIVYDAENRTLTGEDFVFCDKVRAAGFTIGALTDIRLAHIGIKAWAGSFKEGFERGFAEE